MKRQVERALQAWRSSQNRKPLILKGLRQVGKTFLLTRWGKENFARCHYVNFEQMTLAQQIFAGDLAPQRLLAELAFLLDTTIVPQTDLLIFDEIQACPNALNSLKYFYEQAPTVAVAAAGSLLGLSFNAGNAGNAGSFPVGKTELIDLYPMSFSEFLLALGDQQALDFLLHCTLQSHTPEVVHQHLWTRLRWYFVTGGLPEVVATFVAHQDDLPTACRRVREKQQQLLFAYYADFAKHAGKVNAMHIERVWRAVPQQLAATHNAAAPRFQFRDVVPGIDRYQRLAGAIDWLIAAKLVLPAAITAHAEVPLMAYCQAKLFKLYGCDIGLLGAMAGLPAKLLLSFGANTYHGYFVENFVAQELTCANNTSEPLFCWQQQRAEIEFLRTVDAAVVPIEVKAGHIVRAKSLAKFAALYRPPFCTVISGKPLQCSANMHHYPLYLAGRFPLS